MTASARMAGLVEAYGQAVHETAQPDSTQADGRVHDDASAALLAAIGELERDRDAQAAEVARLAGVARELADRSVSHFAHDGMCDVVQDYHGEGVCNCRLGELRASIPTPAPAAFVAAVERLMDACAVNARLPDSAPDDPAASPGMAEEIAAKAALLAMGGVR